MSDMRIEAGIIRVLQGERLNYLAALKEWIDNSLGARAKTITIRRTGECLEIIDDGDGCDDLKTMESLAASYKKSHNKASMYGIGGVLSQIRASIDGLVEVESITKKNTSKITVDWNECIANDKIGAKKYSSGPALGMMKTGTTIRIPKAKRFYSVEQYAEDLGHAYAGELRRAGRKIEFDINGKVTRVIPFKPYPFDGEPVRFDFDYQGHRIKGFCGVVKPGVTNRFPGWSVHWGYRVAFITHKPANGRRDHRIYGEVELPHDWKNINPTKDDFTNEIDDLWEIIGGHCEEVIVRGDQGSSDFELSESSEMVSDILTGAIAGKQTIAKGRRPGAGSNRGTVNGTGNGSTHRNFSTAQTGEKPVDPTGNGAHARIPQKISVAWDDTLDRPYSIVITGTKSRTLAITLNKSNPRILEFKDDPGKLATMCCSHIAHELTYNSDFANVFPEFQAEQYHETYSQLLSRVVSREVAVAGR